MDLDQIERLGPMEIERRSFEIISEEAGDAIPNDERAMIIKRVIHTSADFDYIRNLCFSDHAVEVAQHALRNGAWIVTDTKMALSGINKKSLQLAGGEAHCFISDEDVAADVLPDCLWHSECNPEPDSCDLLRAWCSRCGDCDGHFECFKCGTCDASPVSSGR